MILVDTSVWVTHLKVGDEALVRWLRDDQVLTHPFVEGELLLAGAPVVQLLAGVGTVPVAAHHEVRDWARSLTTLVRGVGWVDLHLACAARLAGARLATYDRRLAELVVGIGGL